MNAPRLDKLVESYLQCKTKAYLSLAQEAGETSDFEAMLERSKTLVRQQFIAKVKASQVQQSVLLDSDALCEGSIAIADACVSDERGEYIFDLLLRKPGKSKLGEFHYAPLIFHGGYSTPRNARIQLEFGASLIGDLQGLRPKSGYVVHAGCRGTPRLVKLSGKPSELKKLKQGIADLAIGEPKLELNAHCPICTFRERCSAKAESEDSLSRLVALPPSVRTKLARRGIFTLTQYSYTFRARRNQAQYLTRQYALQAMAIRERKLFVIGTPSLPDSETEAYLDLEGDPERQFVYLVGVLVVSNGEARSYSFWADSVREEQAMLASLENLIESLGSCSIFVYGSFEAACVKRWSKLEKYKRLCELIQPRMVNVLKVIYSHLYFPTFTNGLKEIASALGFRWRAPKASGLQSIVWRRTWEMQPSVTLKNDLIQYNIDDCVALRIVTNAVRAIIRSDPKSVPWPTELVKDRPLPFERPQWEDPKFQIPDFDFINQRAYFDYQRDRVYVRKANVRGLYSKKANIKSKRIRIRPNHQVKVELTKCPHCGAKPKRWQDLRLARIQYDLRFGRSSVRRLVSRVTSDRFYCTRCKRFLMPDRYWRLRYFGHALTSWIIFQNVAHQNSFESIASSIRDIFTLPVTTPFVFGAKRELATCIASAAMALGVC